ncbi:peptide chain release factor 1 [PVC group bacterium (ex Bugula neritina AB1)]|nr:peptide chain release factor 1 [PVC group bacterium (ex Bugula neritina AB1)]
MFEKLIDELVQSSEKLEQKLSDPLVIADQKNFIFISKEYSKIKRKIEILQRIDSIKKGLLDTRELIKDFENDLSSGNAEDSSELKDLAEEEHKELSKELVLCEKELKMLFLPKEKMDDRDIIVEVRAGTGGEEASLFCEEIFRMYQSFAEKKKWSLDILDSNRTELGGFKAITFSITGDEIYRLMKYESGTHRVQRVPQTESSGRIHTSAVTVAVLPEAEEVEVNIDAKDLRIDVYRAGGPGGQSVNTMDSAVRITHLPTGMIVQCQDGKSQRQNRLQAMKVLRTRLWEKKEEELMKERADARKSQVGSGDRSEKIRTYNFPQGRVTDHRIPLTLYKLEAILSGEIDSFIEALIEKDYASEISKLSMLKINE